MTLFEEIQTDMYAAMKARQKEKTITLRTTLSKIKDKIIEKREDLTETEEIKIVQNLVKQRRESAVMYNQGNRPDLARAEEDEILILEQYLPVMMNAEDTFALVDEVIAELDLEGISNMGRVMQEVMKRGGSLIDGKRAQLIVREKMSK
ncbi:MAG: GatB/YqeY domain-containing protein [Candidatus Neomarinimicrobiota bacterium]